VRKLPCLNYRPSRKSSSSGFLAVLVTAIGLAGIPLSAMAQAPRPVKIAFVAKAYIKDFWIQYKKGALAAGLEPGVTVIESAAASESDTRGQIAIIQALLLQGIDALVVTPVSPAVQPALEEAVAQGVKVVLANDDLVSFTKKVAYVGPDQSASAVGGASYLVEKLGRGIHVGILTAPGIDPVERRLKGVEAFFKQAGVDVVAKLSAGQCNQTQGQNVTLDMLQAHPQVDVIYSLCSPPDLGSIQAIEQLRLRAGIGIHVAGYDGSPQEFAAIKAGRLMMAVYQRPFDQGRIAVETAVKAARGESVPQFIPTSYVIVDSTNVDAYLK
jgi:ABC-type sugar transport system substrate-binding protein